MAASNPAPVDVEPDPLIVQSEAGSGVDIPPPGAPPQLTPQLQRDHAVQPAWQPEYFLDKK